MLDSKVPFLATKLQPPRRVRGVIPRPRLDSLLEQCRGRLLTLIKAPPGSGKTTLALGWSDELAAQGARVAWLAIDPEDDDPDRFPLYIAAALNKACPSIWNVSREMSNPLLRSVDYLMATLVNDLAAQPDELFLFLDDYHLIASEKVHQQVTQLLRRAPDNFHLIILGRGEPPLPLSEFRTRDEVFEIDSSALRFDVEETAQLARKAGYAELPGEDLWALSTVTNGWVAAMRAVILSLREQRDVTQYLKKLSGLSKPISGLFAELLDHLPTDVTHFMLRISVVERVSGTLAESLTGRTDGQAMLDRIEQQQLFLGVLDQDGLWFAFHPLFRDYLQRRLQGTFGTEVLTLHSRAASWYSTRGMWADAVKHALAAGDSTQALAWIDQCAMDLVGSGDVFTLMSWERQLHSYVLNSPSRLRLALAWGLGLGMALDESDRLLRGVEAELDDATGDEAEWLRVGCRALRSMMLAFQDDTETAGQIALSCLAERQLDGWLQHVLMTIVAAAYLDARRWKELYALPQPSSGATDDARYRVTSAYYLSILGSAEFMQGHLERAADYLEDAANLDSESGGVSMITAMVIGKLAQVRYEQNRLEDAFRLYPVHRDAITLVGSVDCLIGSYRVGLAQSRRAGDIQRVRALLDEAERLFVARRWYRAEAAILVERARMALEDDRLMEANGCIERLEELVAVSEGCPATKRVEIFRHAALAKAWVRMAEGRVDSAVEYLEPQLDILCTTGEVVEQVRLSTAMAVAHLESGDEARARTAFLEACRLAATSGAIRPILDQPVSLAPLLDLVRKGLPAELKPVFSGIEREVSRVDKEETGAAAPAAEALSPRERHILKLLAEGNSNKEIARALSIAPETVKSHLKHVYSKLKVDNRAQAAARAQSLLDGV